MLQGVEHVFDDYRNMLKRLKKKSYETKMNEFLEQHGHYFREMTTYIDAATEKEKAAKELSVAFVEAVKAAFEEGPKKKIAAVVQADLNFFMIYFVFPAILKTEHEERKLIADSICAEWNHQMKGNDIGYTDYDTLYASFRQKIFGIF